MYLISLGAFLVINSTSSYFIPFGVIKWANYVNVVTHYFQNLLWIQYACLSKDNYFVIEIQKSLGPAADYMLFGVFGIHTLGTSMHPLVDSQFSLTGNHGCEDEKTDMIILHGTLSILQSILMVYVWILLHYHYSDRQNSQQIGETQL